MTSSTSIKNDPRLQGEGARQAWPIFRSIGLFILGGITIFPVGVTIGLALSIPPDFAPFGLYILIGIILNLVIGLIFLTLKKRILFYSYSSPSFLLLGIITIQTVIAHI